MKKLERGIAVPGIAVMLVFFGILAAAVTFEVRQVLISDSSRLEHAITLAKSMKPIDGAEFIFNAQRSGQCRGFCWAIGAPDRARKVEFELMHQALADNNPEAYLFLFGELERYLEYKPLVDEFLPKVLAMEVTRGNDGWLPAVQSRILASPRFHQHLQTTSLKI